MNMGQLIFCPIDIEHYHSLKIMKSGENITIEGTIAEVKYSEIYLRDCNIHLLNKQLIYMCIHILMLVHDSIIGSMIDLLRVFLINLTLSQSIVFVIYKIKNM